MEAGKLADIQTRLLKWYAINGRSFPWRDKTASIYEIIVSEILLQRTRAQTVSKNYQTFFSRFPSWETLFNATEEELIVALKPFGLNKLKSARLRKLAEQMEYYEGVFPKEKDLVRELSLFGHYTTNAFELFALNKPSALLDVNMARFIERYFEPGSIKDFRYDKKVNKLAKNITNHSKSQELNWAILDFATLVCIRKNPVCEACPLNENCNYYAKFMAYENT